jgi:hypothetical protein
MGTLFKTMIVMSLVCTVLFPLGWRYFAKQYVLSQEEIVWEIEVIKWQNGATVVEPGWEPFGFDKDTNGIFVKRKVVKGGDAP